MPRRPVAQAMALTLAQDLTVIDRIESVLRLAAADRLRLSPSAARRRFTDWLANRR
jgi:hypothetical protein